MICCLQRPRRQKRNIPELQLVVNLLLRYGREGKMEAAIQVEHLTDEVAKTREVDILCGYVVTSFRREQESHIYEKICAEHSAVRA